eukprot:CAMPEP_0119477868 /NCGR_PEP_ID=MMETSP1344-20130328/7852_1 /TAXON_ID=236787 /ORGANISM="Florenciella parvula, Strain CCMP2471" /LENGTH=65 /DNA_ID=CAMNT_0007511961 /DNA_START=275 /DNA_END=470 /DNA_ORIENTATION=-
MGAASNYMGTGFGDESGGDCAGWECAASVPGGEEANLRVGEHVGVKDIEFGGRFDRPHGVTVYVF